MITPKAFEASLNDRLSPFQPIVVGLLIVIILAAVWLIIQPSATLRTGGLLWFLLP